MYNEDQSWYHSAPCPYPGCFDTLKYCHNNVILNLKEDMHFYRIINCSLDRVVHGDILVDFLTNIFTAKKAVKTHNTTSLL